MAKKKKGKSSSQRKNKRTANKASSSSTARKLSWADKLEFRPINDASSSPPTASAAATPGTTTQVTTTTSGRQNHAVVSLRIVSWNILAESYLTRRSHHHLPRLYQDCVFVPQTRRALVYTRLKEFHAIHDVDVLCLQEVDLPLEEVLQTECGYESVLTPTSKAGNATGSRVDACGIYVLARRWKILNHEVIRLDDLASLGGQHSSTTSTTTSRNSRSSDTNNGTTMSSLQGLSTTFLRRNVGLLCRLQHVETGQTVVVANAHIYWNPEYEYVKLCQVHYVMQRAQAFAQQQPPTTNGKEEGIVFCGDLNSPTHSLVHEYLSRGVVNAKRVAPWYRQYYDNRADSEAFPIAPPADTTDGSVAHVQNQLANLSLDAHANADDNEVAENNEIKPEQHDDGPQIRYIMDFTLNRVTRWLRILGIDAALETEDEEIQRTKENNVVLFERCRNEKRTLVTTSYKLLLRKDCPPGTYLVNAKSLASLEAAFVHLLLHHGVTLEPKTFLTRCVICNGSIKDVTGDEDKRRVFAANNAPDLCDQLNDVYECYGCGQGYWWCDEPNSSASRVKSQATRLFELCLRGGVPINGPLHMFDFVDVEQERKKGLEEDDIEIEHLDVMDWLKDEHLSCPRPLESSYAKRDDNGVIVGEHLPFTNVTFDFVGALDYIWFDTGHFRSTELLHVPTSFKELNGRQIPNGHLLPSSDWPSDHLAIGVQLELARGETRQEANDDVLIRENRSAVSKEMRVDSNIAEESMHRDFVNGDSGGIPAQPASAPSTHESEDRSDLYCGVLGGDSGYVQPPPPPPLTLLKTTPGPSTPESEDKPQLYCGVLSGDIGSTQPPPPPPLPPPVSQHPDRCACGCVPKILSMFEMAELRKKAKEKQAKIKAAARKKKQVVACIT